ncbi:MAG: FG-GAP-like repeat-containing protein [Gemmataceae bacterium]
MPDARPSRLPWLLVAVLLVAAGVGAWVLLQRPRGPAGDPVAASHANARGVGHMEQFEYAKAADEFQTALDRSPGWLPARINLGIALYNSTKDNVDPVLARAVEVFNGVLKDDPDNVYAHYNLGIIHKYRGELAEAAPHFEAVTRLDPSDAHAWLNRGVCDPQSFESDKSREFFEKALALNPYLNQARYRLATHTGTTDAQRKELNKLFQDLQVANWEEESREKYTEMGRYAGTIGGGPAKPPAAGPPPVFAQTPSVTAKLPAVKLDPVRQAHRDRFGGVMVRLDYNGDGKPDLLLLSAAERDGGVRDVLLRNDGSTFTDVSVEAGLTGPGSLACAVGDFDNDGKPDLALGHPGGLRLLRNVDGKQFDDKTAAAGFDKLTATATAVAWIDIDQDGDLDLLVGTKDGLAVFANSGEAPPARADQPTPPLSCKFERSKAIDMPPTRGPVAGIVAFDIDGDKDVDIVLLIDGQSPVTVLNDRLLRFRHGLPVPSAAATWAGGVVIDANGDDQSDLVLLPAGEPPRRVVSFKETPDEDTSKRFAGGAVPGPALVQAHRCDLDLDGRADLVGLSADRKPVLLHGQGDPTGRFTLAPEPFGPAADKLPGLLAVAVADVNGNCTPDLIVWDADGVKVFPAEPNGNRGLKLRLTGKRDATNAGVGQKNLRTNSDGIGSKVAALTGPLSAMVEHTTLSAGPGQSLLPLDLGLGKATQADAVRIRWPDGVVQAELGTPACELVAVGEINRKPTSCPVLMTWDGAKWVYVTDFLGGGALGEVGPDGSVRPARPEESVKIEPHQLGLKDGHYVLRIAEPMDEVLYLDHVRLDVIDHPAETAVFPDERFAVGGSAPTQQVLTFRDKLFPAKVTDHRGRDVTAALRERDGKTADGFAHRSWLGYAEDHWIEFDFGDRRLSLPAGKPAYMVLAGWTDYPYPESIYAATQAGVPTVWPVLERLGADGKWQTLGSIGLPAGLPKVMTVPAGDWFKDGGRFRIRTNLQIYWDQLFLAVPVDGAKARELPPAAVTLSHPGFVQEITPTGKPPIAYNPDRFEPVATTKWQGSLTRLGNVSELMATVDDRFVLAGPGDEVTVRFDAAKLPPLPAGWVRSFVLRTHGYCKDTAPTTLSGGCVGPLPVRGMATYPCPETANPHAAADRAKWHTRPAGRR